MDDKSIRQQLIFQVQVRQVSKNVISHHIYCFRPKGWVKKGKKQSQPKFPGGGCAFSLILQSQLYLKRDLNIEAMDGKSGQKERGERCDCSGHSDFDQIMGEIKKRANFEECLESADDLYSVKKYNILELTPKKIVELYNSVCSRVYMRSICDHQNNWVGYELKIFVWLVVCHLSAEISTPEKIDRQCWQKFSRIFHNKNIELIEYQAKLINCSLSQPRKWEKHEQTLLCEIMKSSQIKSKWNQVAKHLYLKSEKKYFRNPKQIREHWLNHLDPQICKSEWTPAEDLLIVSTVLENGRKWALVAKLGGCKRTEHMIKNRFYALLRNQQKSFQHIHEKQKLLRNLERRLTALVNKSEREPKLQYPSPQGEGLEEGSHAMEDEPPLQQQPKSPLYRENKNNKQQNQNIEDIALLEYHNWAHKFKDGTVKNDREDELDLGLEIGLGLPSKSEEREIELVSFMHGDDLEELYGLDQPYSKII